MKLSATHHSNQQNNIYYNNKSTTNAAQAALVWGLQITMAKNTENKKSARTILNETFKSAKAAADKIMKSPLGCINVLNSASFKADSDIKAALKATGETKWNMDMMYQNERGRVCKLTKHITKAQQWADVREENLPYVIIEGEAWLYTEVQKFSVNIVLDLVKTTLNAMKGIEERKERAARKAERAAKKASKGENKKSKKSVTENELVEYFASLSPEAQLMFMAQVNEKKTAKAS